MPNSPAVEQFIEDIAHALGGWAYLLVAFMATAETAAFLGFIAPGEFTIILGGVLAGEGELSIWLLVGVVWASIVLGDSMGFLLGRRLGRAFAVKHGHRVRLSEERLARVEDYFRRHGGKTIFFGRWVGFVRPLMPFTAGTSRMPYKRFLAYDVLSAGIFGATFSLLGYIFWHSLDTITAIVGRGAIAFGLLVALVAGGYLAVKRLRDPEARRRLAERLESLGRRPALRPLAFLARAAWRGVLRPLWRFVVAPVWHLAAPPLRFLAQRLTPGALGLELTTLLTVAAVAAYVFGLYTDVITTGSATVVTPGDDVAFDVARDANVGVLTAVADGATVIGAWPLMAAVVFTAAAALLVLRRLAEAAVLAIGFGLTEAAVYTMKALIERPRPSGALVHVDGWSFPSGHAATGVALVALAVIVARALPTASWRVAFVAASITAAVLTGLSRVYFRAHYLSDVTSGWALALAIFSLCASVALVIGYVRKNDSPQPASGARSVGSAGA